MAPWPTVVEKKGTRFFQWKLEYKGANTTNFDGKTTEETVAKRLKQILITFSRFVEILILIINTLNAEKKTPYRTKFVTWKKRVSESFKLKAAKSENNEVRYFRNFTMINKVICDQILSSSC